MPCSLKEEHVGAAGLAPLFPGNTDLDQLGRVTAVLGSIDERQWPGAKQLPDYGKAGLMRHLALPRCMAAAQGP